MAVKGSQNVSPATALETSDEPLTPLRDRAFLSQQFYQQSLPTDIPIRGNAHKPSLHIRSVDLPNILSVVTSFYCRNESLCGIRIKQIMPVTGVGIYTRDSVKYLSFKTCQLRQWWGRYHCSSDEVNSEEIKLLIWCIVVRLSGEKPDWLSKSACSGWAFW